MKKALLALLVFSTLSTVAIPAYADQANVQTSDVTAITTGRGNVTDDGTGQRIDTSRTNANDNSGNVQSHTGYSDTYGDRNTTKFRTIQNIDDNSSNHPSRASYRQ